MNTSNVNCFNFNMQKVLLECRTDVCVSFVLVFVFFLFISTVKKFNSLWRSVGWYVRTATINYLKFNILNIMLVNFFYISCAYIFT